MNKKLEDLFEETRDFEFYDLDFNLFSVTIWQAGWIVDLFSYSVHTESTLDSRAILRFGSNGGPVLSLLFINLIYPNPWKD